MTNTREERVAPAIEACLDEMFLPVNMLDQLGAWEDEIRALVKRASVEPSPDVWEAIAPLWEPTLRRCREAIAGLPQDALGMAVPGFGIPGRDEYPIRDELLAEIDTVLPKVTVEEDRA